MRVVTFFEASNHLKSILDQVVDDAHCKPITPTKVGVYSHMDSRLRRNDKP